MLKAYIFAILVLVGTATACTQSVKFLLDVSGSMQGKEEEMVYGVNNLLKTIRKDYDPNECQISVEFHIFDHELRFLKEASLFRNPFINVDDYAVRGSTALYDSLATVIDKSPDGAIIVIATDGMDNQSREHTPDSIKAKIADAEKKRNIEFVFVAEGPDAFTGGAHIGFANTGIHTTNIASSFVGMPNGVQGPPGPPGAAGMAVAASLQKKIKIKN